jgi:hypothetical protein
MNEQELIEMGRAAVLALTHDEFAPKQCDEVDDLVHPDAFGEALERERFENMSAADISDAIHEGISLAYWARRDEEARV